LARELDAEIFLARVVVVIDAFSGLRFDPDILRMIEDSKRYLVELASRFELPADRTVPLVKYGDNAARELIGIAEDEGIDLIMMANRCKDWLQRLARGSVCWDVVNSRLSPVCVCAYLERGRAVDVAQWRRKELPMRILLAVDGSPECEVALRVAARWVGVLNADIYLLQVIRNSASTRDNGNHEPEWEGSVEAEWARGIEAEVLAKVKKARTYLDELVSRYELPADRTRCLVGRSDEAAEKIITIAENKGIDLIVMSSHCRSWLGQLTKGSVCGEVIRSRVCPVLCVPLPAEQLRRQPWGVLARRR
jgi:nucleotide-binding universal stress UspA family protein